MMRVLLLYPYPHHRRMMETFSLLLRNADIYNDIICVRDFNWIHNSDIPVIKVFEKLSHLQNNFRPYRYRDKYVSLFNNKIMKLLFSLYDKVDIHAFRAENLFWAKVCHEWNIKYDITLWGSEVLRATDQEIKDVEWGYEGAKSIRSIAKMTNRLSNIFNHKYDYKMFNTYFGNTNYDIIDKISFKQADILANNLGIKIPGKLIVTCGYNGHPQQQHDIMIEVLKKLPSHIKGRINVVVPMTYGLNESYYQEIKKKLDNIDINHIILKKFLKPEELAALRITSDIVINTQTTDAFCSALQDHLYCKNVVIIADWLDYPEYDNNNVFYIKTSIENLYNNILYSIEHYEELKEKTQSNKEKLKKLTSWSNVLPAWVEAMKS